MSVKFKWETEFKETEIGEIPKDWEVRKIKDFYNLKYGITASSNEYGNCRLLRQTDLKKGIIDPVSIPYAEIEIDRIEKYLLKEDDLVISRIANVGSIGYVNSRILNSIDKPLVFGSYLLKFEKTREIHNKFTFYFLSSSQMQNYIKSIAEGSTRQNTNAKVVGAFPLCVPPSFEEQSRIATVLSWFDDLIENKKRQNEILEKVAMAIFKSWFVDFEPFKDEEFVYNEELGKEIPKGWEVKKLKEIANIIRGVSFNQRESSFEHFPNSVPILRANNIKEHMIIDFSNMMFIPASKISKEKYLQEKDLVMIASNGNPKLVGKFSIYIPHPQFKSFSVGAFMYCIRIKKNFSYVLSVLNSEYFEHFLSGVISGTNITNLKKSDLEKFKFPLPPQPIIQRFHSLVEPLFQKIILNQKQIMVLRKIRDALLPKLVFGKLRVEEV